MSNIPHPVIKIPNKQVRDLFIAELYNMGYKNVYLLTDMQNWIEDDYYFGIFCNPPRVSYITPTDLTKFALDDIEIWGHPLIVCNSRAQLLSYLKRTGIKPFNK